MTTVTCQHSGLEFESKSGRAKNHPALDSLLKDAYKRGVYGETMDALKAVRAAGGYETAEQYLARVNGILAGKVSERRARQEAQLRAEQEAEKARKEAKRQREAQNAFLRQHGYTWHKYAIGSEEDTFPGGYAAGIGEFDHYEWYLESPDGRDVSVEQAMDEIERGVDVVLAEREARAIQEAAEREARAAVERAAKEAAEREAEAEHQREQDARRQVETVEVERFDYTGFERIYSHMHNPRVSSSATTVYAGTINGVPAGVVNRYSSYGNDFDDHYTYYCADPEAAGLQRVAQPEPGTLASTGKGKDNVARIVAEKLERRIAGLNKSEKEAVFHQARNTPGEYDLETDAQRSERLADESYRAEMENKYGSDWQEALRLIRERYSEINPQTGELRGGYADYEAMLTWEDSD